MFKEKVLLSIPEKRDVAIKVLAGRRIKIYKYMSKEEVLYCVKESIKIYEEDTFNGETDMFVTPTELVANTDIMVTQLCTNIDVQNLDFGTMCQIGLHDFLKANIIGYSIVEDVVRTCVQHIHTAKLLEGIGNFATEDNLKKAEDNLGDMLKTGAPENVKDLIMAQIANNPAIADVYKNLDKDIEKEE